MESEGQPCPELKFRQLVPRDRTPEVPTGDTDLIAFYNLLRIYTTIYKRTKITNYHTQLSGTGFSSYRWYGGEGCSLDHLPSSALQLSAPSGAAFPDLSLDSFALQPGKVFLTEAEKGPLVDTSALGEVPSSQAEAKKQKSKGAVDREAGKPKKNKKEKKKRRRSLDVTQG